MQVRYSDRKPHSSTDFEFRGYDGARDEYIAAVAAAEQSQQSRGDRVRNGIQKHSQTLGVHPMLLVGGLGLLAAKLMSTSSELLIWGGFGALAYGALAMFQASKK